MSVISFALFLFFLINSKKKIGIVLSVFILTFCLGVFRFCLADKPAPVVFESQVGHTGNFYGEIIDEPNAGEINQKFTVETQIDKSKTDILVTADLGGDFKYGDRVNLSGKLEKPENFITDQGKEFDYVNYLRKDGILYVIKNPKVEVSSRNNGSVVKSILFYAKEKFLEKMGKAIPDPENLLMGGLILGEKASFDQAMRQSFVNTGTIHIIALSGYNVTIVAEWIMKLFSAFPVNVGIGAGILTVLLFIIMTGGSSTAVRAGIMATLALVARATGRNYDVARALLLAGVLMVLVNPFILAFDVSFQLSFIATIAVIFLAPKVEQYFQWVPEKFGLRDIVSVTVAAYVFVMPFILYKMGNLSMVALPANILILPFIPFTMLLGFLTGFSGLIWFIFAMPLGWISYIFLHYELSVIGFFSNLPFASFSIPDFPFFIVILIYLYLSFILFSRNLKEIVEELSTEK